MVGSPERVSHVADTSSGGRAVQPLEAGGGGGSPSTGQVSVVAATEVWFVLSITSATTGVELCGHTRCGPAPEISGTFHTNVYGAEPPEASALISTQSLHGLSALLTFKRTASG